MCVILWARWESTAGWQERVSTCVWWAESFISLQTVNVQGGFWEMPLWKDEWLIDPFFHSASERLPISEVVVYRNELDGICVSCFLQHCIKWLQNGLIETSWMWLLLKHPGSSAHPVTLSNDTPTLLRPEQTGWVRLKSKHHYALLILEGRQCITVLV